MDIVSRTIAEYAATLRFDELPRAVADDATRRIVDTIGCAMAGRQAPQVTIGRSLVSGCAPAGYPGRLLFWAGSVPPDMAGFVNTAAIRAVEWNDAYVGSHPSDMLGGLLALTDVAGADGQRLVTAMVVAYEVVMRLNEVGRFSRLGWDQGYIVGLGTVAGLGSLLGRPAQEIAEALAITSAGNVPMRSSRAGRLSHWKGAATSYAIRNAIFGTLLAAQGMTGPDQPFCGRHGLWEQITGPFELSPFGGRGGDFGMLDVWMKRWPTEGGTQMGVWLAYQILERVPHPDAIARIELDLPYGTFREVASEPEKWDPKTRETADHSLPYVLARALRDGSFSIDAYETEAYLDPALRPLMERIAASTSEDEGAPYVHEHRLDAVITTVSGERHEIQLRDIPGSRRNPLSDKAISEKFLGIVEQVVGPQQARTVLAEWWAVREQDAAGLTRALDRLRIDNGAGAWQW